MDFQKIIHYFIVTIDIFHFRLMCKTSYLNGLIVNQTKSYK